jgi:hypothetical protein
LNEGHGFSRAVNDHMRYAALAAEFKSIQVLNGAPNIFLRPQNIHGRSVQQGWNASGLVLLVTRLLPAAVTLL